MQTRFLQLLQNAARLFFLRPCKWFYQQSASLRNRYWDRRAIDIDDQWGKSDADFETLSSILDIILPQRILDFGCGSGRLFPLYHRHGIHEVVGQDISERALTICRQRWSYHNYSLVCQSVTGIKYPDQYFDLVISNRTLQHVPPSDLEAVIKILTRLGKSIYINEMSDSDCTRKFYFMYLHNYKEVFGRLGFRILKTGLIKNQRWILFVKQADRVLGCSADI